MLTTKFKPIDEILRFIDTEALLLSCEGCREISCCSDAELFAAEIQAVTGTRIKIINMANMCCPWVIESFEDNLLNEFKCAAVILVASCGAGVQTAAEFLREHLFTKFTGASHFGIQNKQIVVPVCNTICIPGYQGLTPSGYNCIMCAQCRLNETAGICPVTSCAKSLLNGQCGGAKGGMCEVSPNMRCGWERINERLSKRIKGTPKNPITISRR